MNFIFRVKYLICSENEVTKLTPMKFEIIIDNERAMFYLLDTIRRIIETKGFIKVEITKIEEAEE